MEPFDYPDNDPGPQTLLTTLDTGQNVDRLYWLMSRFQGYVGISNFMGGRFTASEPALAPVLKETAKRGLIYLDDGTSSRSLAGQIAGANNLAFAKAEVVIDAVPTPAEIDRALARLEAAARERGIAVGIAGALPVAIERIAKWAKAAEGRGFTLVPISAVANKPKCRADAVAIDTRFSIKTPAKGMDSGPRAFARRNDGAKMSTPTNPCPIVPAPPSRCSTPKASSSSAAGSTARSIPTPTIHGSCHRAASIRGKILTARRCASSTRKPASARCRSSAKFPEWLTYDIPARNRRPCLARQIPRADAEMVRAALHRQGERDQHRRARRRRAQTGIRRSGAGRSLKKRSNSWCRSSSRFMRAWCGNSCNSRSRPHPKSIVTLARHCAAPPSLGRAAAAP